MCGKIVDWNFNILVPQKPVDLFVGQIKIERVRRIEIIVGCVIMVLLSKIKFSASKKLTKDPCKMNRK